MIYTDYSKNGYSPETDGQRIANKKSSRGFGSGRALKRTPPTILEEDDGIDMGLLNHAQPISRGGEVEQPAEDRDTARLAVDDIPLALRPGTWHNQGLVRKLQEREAQGRLTGGLGRGIKTDATILESDLLATSPVIELLPPTPLPRSISNSLSRTFTLGRRKSHVGRTEAVKRLGQSEADKSGKVIEVIIEEEAIGMDQSEIDLSHLTGPNTGIIRGPSQMRQSAFPMKEQRKEIFYPQPNWKPFSMRWPYLLSLILLSAGLGCASETIYQMSLKKPLMTFHTPSDIPSADYFAFKFLPTLISVTFGVLWQITDFEVKRLEAFYQLSREGGALAAESINVDYITNFSFLRPIHALYRRHYAVAVSSVATILANALVPTLGAASIVLWPDREARLADPVGEKVITISRLWSRFLTAVFFIIALLGCVLFYQLQSRKSGLLADVKGIAGLASMAVVSHILMDFKAMDVATPKDIHQRLKSRRYVLRNSSLAPDHANPPTKHERDRYENHHLSQNPHPLMLRPLGAIPFLFGIGLFLVFTPVFLFTPATILTGRAPWIITALAVCIKLGWGSLETDVRMLEPYYILSRRHAPPKTLTLDYTALPFFWVAVQALLNRHWLVFFVGFGSVLAELLTVLATSLATVEGRDFIAVLTRRADDIAFDKDSGADINAGQETVLSFWISLCITLFILSYLFLVAIVTFLRRRTVFLPRQPNTVASVLAFIHQSKMLYDFVGTSKMSTAEVREKLEGVGKTYGMGWFKGRDGQRHCGVDEEELLSAWKYGVDYTEATRPWEVDRVGWL
ncbi:hypothetical protein DL546_009885 [Coniochaeta pulveracea]|uniref:Uncharacterized protein n=1 Tax=Coniochaeta pulveracea TaxID=177199 RepID=A0A420YP91_9PEZI|nr:hypothetical protein DL546_009885 [Coniochaeta pulveracea]